MNASLKNTLYMTWKKIGIAFYILLPIITLLSFISTMKYGEFTERTIHSVAAWMEFSRSISFGLTYMPALASTILCLLSFSQLFTRGERDNIFSQPISDGQLLTSMIGLPLILSLGLTVLMDVEMFVLSLCILNVTPPIFSTALPRYALVIGMSVITSFACIVGKTWGKVLNVFFGIMQIPIFALLECTFNYTVTDLIKAIYYIFFTIAIGVIIVYAARNFKYLRQETGTNDYVSSTWIPILYASAAAIFTSVALVEVVYHNITGTAVIVLIICAIFAIGITMSYFLKHKNNKKALAFLCSFGASVVLMGGLYIGIIQYAIYLPLDNSGFVRSIEWAEADEEHLISTDMYQPTYRSYCLANLAENECRTDVDMLGNYDPSGTRYIITDKLGIRHDVYIDDSESEWLAKVDYGKYPNANDVTNIVYWISDGINTYITERELFTIDGNYDKVLTYIKDNNLFDETTNDSSKLKVGYKSDMYRAATLGSIAPANEAQHVGEVCIRISITIDGKNYQQWYYAPQKTFTAFLADINI